MFTKIIIQNFQNHTKNIIHLHPGVNVFRGASNQGKTTIIRALGWLLFNRPQGFAFKRDGSGPDDLTLVRVVTNDSRAISRAKNAKINEYRLDGEAYKAIRSDVPEDIAQILDMDEVNYQGQFHPYFMLNDSPGEVAKKLNAVVGLDVIDALLSAINKKASIAAAQRDAAFAKQKEAQDQIDRFPDLDKLEKRAKACATLQEQTAIARERRGNLGMILLGASDLEDEIKKLGIVSWFQKRIAEVESKINAAYQQEERFELLVDIERSIRETQSLVDNYVDVSKGLAEAEAIMDRLEAYKTDRRAIQLVLNAAIIAKQNLVSAFEKQQKSEKKIKLFLKENPTCPVCGGKMKG